MPHWARYQFGGGQLLVESLHAGSLVLRRAEHYCMMVRHANDGCIFDMIDGMHLTRLSMQAFQLIVNAIVGMARHTTNGSEIDSMRLMRLWVSGGEFDCGRIMPLWACQHHYRLDNPAAVYHANVDRYSCGQDNVDKFDVGLH